MSEQIPGVPEGWRLVRIGVPKSGEWFVDDGNTPTKAFTDFDVSVLAIIEKIEQPKQYRPFADAKEFEPHRDRWWRFKEESDCYQRTSYYSDDSNSGEDWETSLDGRVFDDGSPFGVEVTE